MYVADGTDLDAREALLADWYRKQLRIAIPPLLESGNLSSAARCRAGASAA